MSVGAAGSRACECAARDARGAACLIQEEDSADRFRDHLCCFTGRAAEIAVDEGGAGVVVHTNFRGCYYTQPLEQPRQDLCHRRLARARVAEKQHVVVGRLRLGTRLLTHHQTMDHRIAKFSDRLFDGGHITNQLLTDLGQRGFLGFSRGH